MLYTWIYVYPNLICIYRVAHVFKIVHRSVYNMTGVDVRLLVALL